MKRDQRRLWVFAIACGTLIAAAASEILAQTTQATPNQSSPELAKGHIAAPPGSETLNIALELHSIQLFVNANFKGTQTTLNMLDQFNPQGKPNELAKGLNDSVSSMRWNLPRGVVVVFYEDAAPKGKQLALWGAGQISELSRWNFNDKASRWAWFNVGGVPRREVDEIRMRPIGTDSLAIVLPENTIQLFKDKKYRDDMTQISPVTSMKAGELHKLPEGMRESLSSLQWNLPEGVVVMFFEDADGKKERVAVWGAGQMSELSDWDFNDKASRWSWAYIGETARSE